MQTKLQKYALIAEVIGGIAIVASLLFVGLQVQQSTSITRASSYQNFLEEINDWRAVMVADPDLRRIFMIYTDEEEVGDLAEEDRIALAMHMGNFFSTMEGAYYSREYGLLGDSEWERVEVGLCQNFKRSQRNEFDIAYISEQFRAYMQDRC